uniref:Uncharacterized protein n=1 Tax=Manihot esculenta TaxID=3983 RepID=A0A251K5Z6_MANES
MGSDTASQSQKKRTLEALERRFAVAKAELIQQQKKTQNENNNTTSSISSIAPPVHLPPAPSTPSCLNSSLKKDLQENGPAYSQLSHPVYENLLTTNKFQSKRGSMVDMILHELLQHGDSAQKYLQGSRSKKIDNWILLDNYVQGRGKSTSSHIRALKAHSKRSKKHMSMKQHKKCGSFVLPQDRQKFTVFKPMHEMWKGYVMQLLQNTGTNQLAQCLLSADLHGAVILVAQCKVASFTGITGIMIRETAETFGILAEDDKFWVVPKKCSVFIFQVDCWKITLQGDKLTSRNLGL